MGVAPRCVARINLSAFRSNVRHAKTTLAGPAQLMVAVKSEGYGHGSVPLSHAAVAAGADALAVLDIAQGIIIREEIPDVPLLCWLHSPSSDFGAAARAELDIGISGCWQLQLLCDQAPGLGTRVHLKIDTGLHRNGALESDWPALVEMAAAREREGHITVVGIWSHLADTSVEEDNASLQRFHRAVEVARAARLTPDILHIAASAAAADVPESRLDLVRIGIIVYGVSPFEDRTALELGFLPVMTVQAQVLSHSGDGTSAVLGMGFADGLLPPTQEQGWVSWDATRYDLEAVHCDRSVMRAAPGDTLPPEGEYVTLFGDPSSGSPLAEDWARWAGTIGDEVVASLGPGVTREFSDDEV
jgi:alanine racemase